MSEGEPKITDLGVKKAFLQDERGVKRGRLDYLTPAEVGLLFDLAQDKKADVDDLYRTLLEDRSRASARATEERARAAALAEERKAQTRLIQGAVRYTYS